MNPIRGISETDRNMVGFRSMIRYESCDPQTTHNLKFLRQKTTAAELFNHKADFGHFLTALPTTDSLFIFVLSTGCLGGPTWVAQDGFREKQVKEMRFFYLQLSGHRATCRSRGIRRLERQV